MTGKQKLPPAARTALWHGATEAARRGEFRLPVCRQCRTIHYPPREICKHCLVGDLEWQAVDPAGRVKSWTRLHASQNDFFNACLPWLVGSIKLDCGPVLFAHLSADCAGTGNRVQVLNRLDLSGQAVFIAVPASDSHDITDTKIRALLGE